LEKADTRVLSSRARRIDDEITTLKTDVI